MSKSIVKMTHEKSNLTITVLRSQVENALYYGWAIVDDEKPVKKQARKKDGKSKR
jgi:hypothetical protein